MLCCWGVFLSPFLWPVLDVLRVDMVILFLKKCFVEYCKLKNLELQHKAVKVLVLTGKTVNTSHMVTERKLVKLYGNHTHTGDEKCYVCCYQRY